MEDKKERKPTRWNYLLAKSVPNRLPDSQSKNNKL